MLFLGVIRQKKRAEEEEEVVSCFCLKQKKNSSVGIVPVFVVCRFQGKKISIQEEQTKAKGGFFFFLDCDYACAHENAGRQTRSS